MSSQGPRSPGDPQGHGPLEGSPRGHERSPRGHGQAQVQVQQGSAEPQPALHPVQQQMQQQQQVQRRVQRAHAQARAQPGAAQAPPAGAADP